MGGSRATRASVLSIPIAFSPALVANDRSSLISGLALALAVSVPVHGQEISWISTNGPATGSAMTMASMADNSMLAVVNGDIYRSADNGASWYEANLPRPDDPPALPIATLASTENGVVFAATSIVRQVTVHQRGVFRSDDFGRSWTLSHFSLVDTLVHQFVAGSAEFVFARTPTSILVTSDGGLTWSSLARPLSLVPVAALAADGMGRLVIILSDGRNLRSSDDGRTWEPPVTGILPKSTSRLMIRGDTTLISWQRGTQTIEISDDRGRSWIDRTPVLREGGRIMGVSINSTDNSLVAGTDEGVFRSYDCGQSWEHWGLAQLTVFDVAASRKGAVLASTNDGVHRLANGTWNRSSVGILRSSVTSIATGPDGTVVAGGFLGDVSISSNRGGSWGPIGFFRSVAAVETMEDGQILVATGIGTPSVYSTSDQGRTWDDRGLSNTSTLYVTAQGSVLAGWDGLYRSTDRASSWKPVDLDASLVLDIAEYGETLYAGTSEGVWVSIDDGDSWTPAGFSGQTIVEVAAGEGVIFATNACQYQMSQDPTSCGIFRSFDEGRSWQNVYSAETVSDLLARRNGELVACLTDEIILTQDNGNSWASHSTGLPTAFPYKAPLEAIAIDTDDYLYLGTFGRSVFRTANPVPLSTQPAREERTEVGPSLSNYPNPAVAETTVTFSVDEPGRLTLTIYDVTGRLVSTLADSWYSAGKHKVLWKTHDVHGGLYVCRLTIGGVEASTCAIVVL